MGRPLTPPALLISSMASSAPSFMGRPTGSSKAPASPTVIGLELLQAASAHSTTAGRRRRNWGTQALRKRATVASPWTGWGKLSTRLGKEASYNQRPPCGGLRSNPNSAAPRPAPAPGVQHAAVHETHRGHALTATHAPGEPHHPPLPHPLHHPLRALDFGPHPAVGVFEGITPAIELVG